MKKSLILLTLTFITLITVACSSQSEVDTFEILNRRDGHSVTAYVDRDHWHGSLPVIPQGQSASLGVNIVTRDGDTIELDSAGEVNGFTASLAEGAEEGIISIQSYGDHLHINGLKEGTTQVVFQWTQDGEVVYTTPSITVTISESEDEPQEIGAFDVLNRRNDNEKVAYIHGNHWHGELPTITVGESISLGAFIVSIDDRERELDPEGEVNGFVVLLADNAPEGKVTLENHGDHVHIYGVEAGITQVVFQWVHRGEVRFTTPPINVYITQ